MLQTTAARLDRVPDEVDFAIQEFETAYANGDGIEAISGLAWFLRDLRLHCSEPDWRSNCARLRETHAFHLLLNDPYTHRAFTKPRGYAGDAVMIDFIYNAPSEKPAHAAEQLHFHTTNSLAANAVRYRRDCIAQRLDALTAGWGASVLAIAAGHLRELRLVDASRTGRIVAFDQDAESLAGIDNPSNLELERVRGSVRHLLAGRFPGTEFDFVYAAGLFDYLDDPTAKRLVQRMLEMTKPGGKVLVANFAPDIPDRGYMEACMDWWLVYRNREQVRELFPEHLRGQLQCYADPHNNIEFAEYEKTND